MPLPDDFVNGLGGVTANFGTLEIYVGFLVTSMISPNQPVGQIIAAELSFQRLLGVADSLARYYLEAGQTNQPAFDRLADLLKRAGQAEEKRNTVVHSSWATDDANVNAISRIKVTARRSKGLRWQNEAYTAEQVHALADEIRSVATDLSAAMGELHKQGMIPYLKNAPPE